MNTLLLIFFIPALVALLKVPFLFFPESVFGNRVHKEQNHKPTVAVVIPCYNEGKAVYDTIKAVWESDYPKDKLTIYPQDDGSVDDSYKWMLKAAEDFDRVFPEKNEKNLGKTDTYFRAMERSQSEILINVDSDTIVRKDCIAKLMACFADTSLGVVGATGSISNTDGSLLTTLQAYQWFFFSRFSKIPENHFKAVQVIGGWALAIRRHILEEIRPEVQGRNWFGCPSRDGEDRYITHMALVRGWGTYVELEAETRSLAMDTYKRYFGQQLRWRRSLIRTFFWMIRTLPWHVRTMAMPALLNIFASALVVLVWFLLTLKIAMEGPLQLVGDATKLVMMLGFASLLLVLLRRLHGDKIGSNPLKLALVIPWWLVNYFVLTLLSFFTLDQDAWGNRDKSAETGEHI